MAAATKFVAVVLLLLAGGYGSSYLIDWGMPGYKTLLNPVSDKFGATYKSYFIDPTYEKNDAWWEWSYKHRWLVDSADSKTSLSTEFQSEKVSSGYSNSDAKALNKICLEAYNKGEQEVSSNYERDVWRYCSLFGLKPKTIKEESRSESYGAGKLGKTKENVLISVEDINTAFWDLKNIEFYGLDGSTPKGAQEADGSYFKSFYEENKHRWKGRENISKGCNEAYKLEKSETSAKNKPSEADVIKFCTLKGK